MASETYDLIFVLGGLLSSTILVYAAYWALNIRRALFVPAYRRQAFWIGFFSLSSVGYVAGLDMGAPGPSVAYALLVVSYYLALAFLFFRLIDVDIEVARRSDPLLREPLHWRRLRLVVLAIMVPAAVGVAALEWASKTGASFPGYYFAIVQGSVFVPFLLAGVPALLLAVRRTGDLTFRRSLKWLGFYFVTLFIANMSYFLFTAGVLAVPPDLFNATGGLVAAPGAYCLYRSARSLAPLNRIASSPTGRSSDSTSGNAVGQPAAGTH